MAKKGAIILPEWYKAIQNMPDHTRLQLYDAICEYYINDREIEFDDPVSSALFSAYQPYMDKQKQHYDEAHERRVNAGRLGGLKKASNANQCQAMPSISSNAKQCQQKEKEKEEEEYKESNTSSITKEKAFDFKRALIKNGVEKELADEWMLIRKNKKAVNSEFSLNIIIREADKAGISIADAVRMSCENQWSGFKAEWYENSRSKRQRSETLTPLQRKEKEKNEQMQRITDSISYYAESEQRDQHIGHKTVGELPF